MFPLCVTDGPKLCYDLRNRGFTYAGHVATTANNITCDSWSVSYDSKDFHYRNLTKQYKLFPEKNIALAKNYCRNPKFEAEGVYCHLNGIRRVCKVDPCGKVVIILAVHSLVVSDIFINISFAIIFRIKV